MAAAETVVGLPDSDEELIERIRENDHAAFDLLYERYFPRVLGFVRRRIDNPADAEETVQDVFLNVFTAAAFAREGLAESEIEAVLRETDPAAFRLDEEGLTLGERRASSDELTRTRQDFATSFGSCSFKEPVSDLQLLGVVP